MNKQLKEIQMIIYKTTNLINGKIYVGQSKHNNKHYYGSGTYIKLAMKKYGKENFKKEVIEECTSYEQMNERELYWIKTLNAIDRNIGYNVKTDTCGIYTTESRKAQGCKGHTEETKQKISKALTNYNRTAEHQQVLTNALSNKDLSYITDEYRNKMSKSTSGEKNGNYGNTHSAETRKKISDKAKGRTAWNKGLKMK
jgi:group I intron endonuclease